MSYCQAATSTRLDNNTKPNNDLKQTNDGVTQLIALNQKIPQTNARPSNKPGATSIIPFVETSTAELTTSTLTSEKPEVTILQQSNIITKIVDHQLQEYKMAMTNQYEAAIKNIHILYSTKIEDLTNKQTKHDKEMIDLKLSQTTMKKDIEKRMDDKVESQTTLLSSLVTLIQDMKTANEEGQKQKNIPKSSEDKCNTSSPKLSQADLTDCSYSEGCSSQSSNHSVKSDSDIDNDTTNVAYSIEEIGEIHPTKNPPNNQRGKKATTFPCYSHENKVNEAEKNDIRKKTRSKAIKKQMQMTAPGRVSPLHLKVRQNSI